MQRKERINQKDFPPPRPGEANVCIKVYYNVAHEELTSRPSGYQEGDPLRCTCEVYFACPTADIPQPLLYNLVVMLASGSEEHGWLREYWKQVPRRLMMGDIIQIGESAWWIKKDGSCEPVVLTQEQIIEHIDEIVYDNFDEVNQAKARAAEIESTLSQLKRYAQK